MTNTKMRDQGGPVPGCPQCHRGNDAYTYGMGVVIKGNWLLQDPLVNGYSALVAYLPSQRIAISLVVTFAEEAFNKTTGSYPNEAVPIFEQIGAKLDPTTLHHRLPGIRLRPRRLKRPWRAARRMTVQLVVARSPYRVAQVPHTCDMALRSTARFKSW